MRPIDVILALAFFAAIGAAFAAYAFIVRRFRRERDEAIEQAAVTLPLVPDDVSALATGYRCPHLSITSAMGVLGNVKSSCGCAMQPIYPVRG